MLAGCGPAEALTHCWRHTQRYGHLGKYCGFLTKLNLHLPCEPAISPPGNLPKRNKSLGSHSHSFVYTNVYSYTGFIQSLKPKSPSTVNRTPSSDKGNHPLTRNNQMREQSQIQKAPVLHDSVYMTLWKSLSPTQKVGQWLPDARGRRGPQRST